MKIVLIMKHDIYHGREFMNSLLKNNFRFDVISILNNKENELNLIEDKRTNYTWRPKKLKNMLKKVQNYYSYKSMSDPKLIELLKKKKYQIGIQGGGIGIIKKDIINKFTMGLLNFHPGDLPFYRGSSAPEWQIYAGKHIIATCHLIDKDLDTGDIIAKKRLDLDYSDYYSMRASIYPKIASFLVDIVALIIKENGIKTLVKQNKDLANYRNYIGDNVIEKLKVIMKKKKSF